MIDTLLTISLIFAATTWTAFSIAYGILAKWWKTPFGRNMMGVGIVITILLDRLALLYLDPDVTADLKGIGLFIYITFGLLGLQRFILMVKAQRAMGKHESLL